MAAAKQRAAAEIHRINTDGDGVISQREFVAAGEKQSDFDRFGWDSTLDRDEVEALSRHDWQQKLKSGTIVVNR